MVSKVKGRMRRKGELFPPKSVRQLAGMKPGDEVTHEATEGGVEVHRISTLKEALAQKKFAKVSFKRFEDMTSEVLSVSSND